MQYAVLQDLLTRPASPSRAREIMKKNFHDVPHALRIFGASVPEKALNELATIPATEAMLEECAETHILVPGLPFTIMEMQQISPRRTFRPCPYLWYQHEPFAESTRVPVHWYLLAKSATSQRAGNFGNDRIPLACELVYGIILHQIRTGERLYDAVSASSSDTDSEGAVVTVQNKVDGIRLNALTSKRDPLAATKRSMLPIVRHMHQTPRLLNFAHVISRI